MLKVGLTGGIASGKSTVARLFAERGAAIVDTDVIAREVVAPGEPGLAAVREAFGDEVLGPDGTLDRRKLRARVFANDAERRRLETLLHPLIRARTIDALDRLGRHGQTRYAIVVVPLLVETDFRALVDRVLVVDCPEDVQLARLTARDAIGEADARAMIRAQTDRATRLAAADDVLDTSKPLESTTREVDELHRRYLDLATVCRARAPRAE